MSSIIRYYYNFYAYYFSVFVATGLILPISLFRPKNVHNAKLISYVVQFLSKILIKDVSFSLRNREILDKTEAAVIVANHQSSLDILGLFMTWHIFDKLSVVAKKVLFYLWPFGLCAYFSGIIFIDREKTKDAYKQLNVTTELMVKKKIKVLLFAEGTRNTSGKGIMPFKKGAFKMAVSAQVPIIPMVYSPYSFIKPDQRLFYQGNVIMECLDPVPTAGLTMEDIPKLAEQVRQKMLVAYERLSKEVTST